jgi:hypothetical protein
MDEEGTWMNISWIHRWRLSPYAFTFRNIFGFLGLWGEKINGWVKRALGMNIAQICKWMDENQPSVDIRGRYLDEYCTIRKSMDENNLSVDR